MSGLLRVRLTRPQAEAVVGNVLGPEPYETDTSARASLRAKLAAALAAPWRERTFPLTVEEAEELGAAVFATIRSGMPEREEAKVARASLRAEAALKARRGWA